MRVLVSACLLGVRCRYDGASKLLPGLELQITVSGQLSHTNDMKE